jgi:hypothetical protein
MKFTVQETLKHIKNTPNTKKTGMMLKFEKILKEIKDGSNR